MKCIFGATVVLSIFAVVLGQPKMGPYTVVQKKYDVAALDSTYPSAWVWYPETNDTTVKFPFISYLHGFMGE